LLVYGLGMTPAEAVPVSLAAAGSAAFAGFLQRLRGREVAVGAGLLLAAGGAAGAPVGAWIGQQLSPAVLMGLFSLILCIAAVRMWLSARRKAEVQPKACATGALSRRCTIVLAVAGLFTGVLAGTFGVGGGFVIVPVLVLATGMEIRRAAATSLLVISIVSAVALVSVALHGQPINIIIALPFLGGGLLGMALGTSLARRLPTARLQQGFAMMMLGVALFTLYSTLKP
jgi:uncharacterized membrane protein YfcA